MGGFDDVVPLEQDDGPSPVMAIRYTDAFKRTMDNFRAIVVANEMTARALELTAEVVDLNPANYTAWEYRRRCLKSLGSDLRCELRHSEEMAYENPKNYQIWFHRRAVVELLGDPGAEMAFINNVLTEDMKNYHAWSYRQWVLKSFGTTHGLWAEELESVHHMLQLDHYNNSAWNQRWFVVSHINQDGRDSSGGDEDAAWPLPSKIILSEVQYAFSWLGKDLQNEAPWAYIRGLMRQRAPNQAVTTVAVASPASATGTDAARMEIEWRFQSFPSVKQNMLKLRDSEEGAKCVPMLSLLLEASCSDVATLSSARELCRSLVAIDTPRASYWERRLAALTPPR